MPGVCSGDCDGSGGVVINELILIVNITLGQVPLGSCASADRDNSGNVAINEIIAAVNQALEGCPA